MSINLDPELIDDFRDSVNEQPIFREMFKNIDGKNKWNIICSAMDWISVSAGGLPHINIKVPNFGYDHLISLNLMQYIVAVDLLAESILQLYRVICGEKCYPLKDDRSVFKQSKVSDDVYFAHIRAVFATHPVNLKSLDGYSQNSGERFYASWSSGRVIDSDADFHAVLYSNMADSGHDFTFFGVKISDVNKYAEKRYALLHDLTEKIEEIVDKHTAEYKGKSIPAISDPIQQLEIMFEENKLRFGSGYGFSYEISTIYQLLKVTISPEANADMTIINDYRDYLLSLIPIIKSGLETVEKQGVDLWPKLAKGYEFEKIYTYLQDYHPIGERYFEELIQKKWLPSYLLNCSSVDEKHFVLNAYLHRASNKGITKFGFGI